MTSSPAPTPVPRYLNPAAARSFYELLRADVDLTDEDRYFLTMNALSFSAQKRLWPRGRAISDEDVLMCMRIAARTMLEAFEAPEPRWQLVVPVFNAAERWHRCLHRMTRRVLDGCATKREMGVVAMAQVVKKRFGAPRDLEQFERAAARALFRLGQENVSREDRLHTLIEYRGLSFGTPGGIMLGNDGRVYLGVRQVRDELQKAHGYQRHDRGGFRVVIQEEPPEPLTDDEEAIAAVDAADVANGLQALANEALRQKAHGKGDVAVLTNYSALKSGALTLSELARRVRCSKGHLHAVLRKHDTAIEAKLRRRAKS